MSSDLPYQLILFGPPGTSKSYLAKHDKAARLGAKDGQIVPIAFHPEYSYGEFVARLLPMTNAEKKIEYTVHAGPFLEALARAYALLLRAKPGEAAGKVVLLIDEINRGNCAEIFGDIFHLLDREEDGWSSYEIKVSDLVIGALRALVAKHVPAGSYSGPLATLITAGELKLPPNLHLLGTMNTSDESIFYMDSAFKRRWNFEFCAAEFTDVPAYQRDAVVDGKPGLSWSAFVDQLNGWIIEACKAPKLDDKLVGPWFIKARRRHTTAFTTAQAVMTELKSLAQHFATSRGADYSNRFDSALLAFANTQPSTLKERIFQYGRYNVTETRKFQAIGSSHQSPKHPFYVSEKSTAKLPENTVKVEEFLKGLDEMIVEDLGEWVHEIPRADIVGKLFLYLWDNVFDRDKTPLATLIGMPREELRTFGQFAAQADVFIGKLMDRKT